MIDSFGTRKDFFWEDFVEEVFKKINGWNFVKIKSILLDFALNFSQILSQFAQFLSQFAHFSKFYLNLLINSLNFLKFRTKFAQFLSKFPQFTPKIHHNLLPFHSNKTKLNFQNISFSQSRQQNLISPDYSIHFLSHIKEVENFLTSSW